MVLDEDLAMRGGRTNSDGAKEGELLGDELKEGLEECSTVGAELNEGPLDGSDDGA